ncbi:Signal transduction histidine kinase [Geodermatophilus saharensis]|uniref:histidine kinase n=1 Tax=Geodermatophilus saharensis TaxID=1137994 RepID=A0A239FH30_9ACTN|nr:histidine kinase [Geodermatophilus saharensis]SNS56061.1 Signal transduction histidine kinase [Geodermatophilus saharensis]
MDQRLPLEQLSTTLRERPFAADVALAALVGLVTVVAPAQSYWGSEVPAFLLGVALVTPLAWRRRAPVPAAAVVTAAGLAELVAGTDFLLANVAALFMVYALAAYAPGWAARGGLVVGLAGAVLAALRWYASGSGEALLVTVGSIAVSVVAAWALGRVRRSRLGELAGLAERARLLEVERDQEMRLAATAERARIAREMHDVVAHSLSVVIAQADGGRYAGRADPAAATGALEAIATTGRQALTDMRALLGVLRDGTAEQYAPQPDVAAVPALVDDVRASGLDVDLLVEGEPGPMAAGPQLAAYRIVQESLTNVLKHAGPGVRAWVRLHWRPDSLELSVLDDGRGAAAAVAGEAAAGDGQGLRGMHERAQLHRGRVEAGPRAGGGWRVHAVLPIGGVR